MTNLRMLFLVLLIAPAGAYAHNGSHPEDPNLHADPSVHDCEVRFASNLTQAAFHRFVQEFGSVSAFKQGASGNTLGRGKISIGVEYMSFAVEEHAPAWNDTFVHPDKTHELGSRLTFPKLKVRAGVTDDTDVGVYFAVNPNSNYGWLGFDVKHAFLREGPEMPVTLSLRGAYTKTLFVYDMNMHTVSLGASVARTFWDRVTPYAGVGTDLVIAAERSPLVDLKTEVVAAPHALAGVEVSLWKLAIGIEAQYAAIPSAQLQTSFVF